MQTKKIKLHLGSGDNLLKGYINVDKVEPHSVPKGIEFIQGDISNLGFLRNKSVDEIKAEFILEHVSIDDIPYILYRWNRVLKIGGIVEAIVPDFDKISRCYTNEISSSLEQTEKLYLYKKMNYHLLNPGSDAHGSLWTEEFAKQIFVSEGFEVTSTKHGGFQNWYLFINAKKVEES